MVLGILFLIVCNGKPSKKFQLAHVPPLIINCTYFLKNSFEKIEYLK